ncbi:melanoma-associated antigen 10-like [Mustela nigripes]|uniref:melanoma-associated antigen 10-like n=1 Tax=Mustela nigripes TaxID=77151 RepID=UPI0028155D4E|nr:melanoma-associated antigen 10-like [Mustela nigripes]
MTPPSVKSTTKPKNTCSGISGLLNFAEGPITILKRNRDSRNPSLVPKCKVEAFNSPSKGVSEKYNFILGVESQAESCQQRPVVPQLPPSCSHFYLLLPIRVVIPHSPECLCLTYEPDFQAQSEIQCLAVVHVLIAKDEEETCSISSCFFNFSYPSTSSSLPSSPMISVSPQKEEGEEPAVTLSPPQIPQISFCSFSVSWKTSEEVSNSQEEEDTGSPMTSKDSESLLRDPRDEKVADLVHFMVLKYQLRRPNTKAEILKVIIKRYKKQFPVILKKDSKCLEVISNINMGGVDPTTHSYVLFNSLDLTHDEMLSDNQSMPKNGLLIIILGVIFIEGNCAPEEDIWDILNMMRVYAWRENFIYGEPRKLITTNWVQENPQVLNSHPPHYEFLWGPRAHAETSKKKVLGFWLRSKGPTPFLSHAGVRRF